MTRPGKRLALASISPRYGLSSRALKSGISSNMLPNRSISDAPESNSAFARTSDASRSPAFRFESSRPVRSGHRAAYNDAAVAICKNQRF